jgi:hypothetical protein
MIAVGGSPQNAKGEAFAFPKPKKKFVPREPVKKVKAGDEAAAAAAAPAAEGAAPATPAAPVAEKPAE